MSLKKIGYLSLSSIVLAGCVIEDDTTYVSHARPHHHPVRQVQRTIYYPQQHSLSATSVQYDTHPHRQRDSYTRQYNGNGSYHVSGNGGYHVPASGGYSASSSSGYQAHPAPSVGGGYQAHPAPTVSGGYQAHPAPSVGGGYQAHPSRNQPIQPQSGYQASGSGSNGYNVSSNPPSPKFIPQEQTNVSSNVGGGYSTQPTSAPQIAERKEETSVPFVAIEHKETQAAQSLKVAEKTEASAPIEVAAKKEEVVPAPVEVAEKKEGDNASLAPIEVAENKNSVAPVSGFEAQATAS